MYTRFCGDYGGLIECVGGELLVMLEQRSLVGLILDNQLKVIGKNLGENIMYGFMHDHERMLKVSITRAQDDGLDVGYRLDGIKTHMWFSQVTTHQSQYVCRRNSWASDIHVDRVGTDTASSQSHAGTGTNTIWSVPKHDLDLFKLPKFRCIITRCCGALVSWLPELRRKILALVVELLQPTDYCEYVDNSQYSYTW